MSTDRWGGRSPSLVGWAWNDRAEVSELARSVDPLLKFGGGLWIQARPGLESQYLGDQWWRALRATAKRCSETGADAWLSDEDRGGPSGFGGGLSAKEPTKRLRALRAREVEVSHPLEKEGREDRLAFLIRRSGPVLRESVFLPPGARVVRPTVGSTLLIFDLITCPDLPRCNGSGVLDVTCPAAVEMFIRSTYEESVSRLGPHLHRYISGFRTSEPNWNLGDLDRSLAVGFPWAAGLAADIASRHGIDVLDRLPELLFSRADGEHLKVRWVYREVLNSRFVESYTAQLSQWCEGNQIKLGGVLGNDHSLVAQVRSHGATMRHFELMHEPGVKVRGLNDVELLSAIQCASASRFTGRPGRAELYAGAGWGANLEDYRATADLVSMLGVYRRAITPVLQSMRGRRKRDFPSGLAPGTPGWRFGWALEEHLARLGALLESSETVGQVGVLHPLESVWASWSPVDDGVVGSVDRSLQNVLRTLVEDHRNVDLLDEDALVRAGTVDRVDGVTRLYLGGISCRVLVLPPLVRLRQGTLALVEEFLDSGGHVVVIRSGAPVRPVPEVAALLSDGRTEQLPDTAIRAALPIVLDRLLPRRLSVVSAPLDGDRRMAGVEDKGLHGEDERVWVRTIRVAGHSGVFMVARSEPLSLGVRIRGTENLRRWDPASNTSWALPDRGYGAHLDLAAGESALLVDAEADAPPSSTEGPLRGHQRAMRALASLCGERAKFRALPPPARFGLEGLSALPLDRARWQPESRPWSEEEPLWHAERALRLRAGLPWDPRNVGAQPWVRRKHGPVPLGDAARQVGATGFEAGRPASERSEPIRFSLAIRFQVEVMPTGPVALVLESLGRVRAWLNDVELEKKAGSMPNGSGERRPTQAVTVADVLRRGYWIDPSFLAIDISECVRKGENVLLLESTQDDELELEPPLLLGEFGTRSGTRRVEAPPVALRFGDLAQQGLAHFVGGVRYEWDLDGEMLAPGETLLLEVSGLQDPSGAVAHEVDIDGKLLGLVPWSPRCIDLGDSIGDGKPHVLGVTCHIGLRNTLGPLHSRRFVRLSDRDLLPRAVSPSHFHPDESGAFDGDALVPIGLLVPPRLVRAPREVISR